MSFDYEFHPDVFFFLPALFLQQGECANPECDATHYKLVVGWTVVSVEVIWGAEG